MIFEVMISLDYEDLPIMNNLKEKILRSSERAIDEIICEVSGNIFN